MARSALVGALRVTLGLDSAQFTQGLNRAQTGLQRFAAAARAGALILAGALTAAGGAVAAAMKPIIDDADNLYKLSQAIGISIEDLSRLRYAAELSGVGLESLGKAVKRLSANMYEAGQSATGQAARAFAALGISVRDAEGRMRPALKVMEDLAARFQKLPNGAEKTALAMQIFGKSGADMIPMLNAGSAGLAEIYAEAEELGIVLDEETGKAAERFNDNLTRLGKVKDGIVTKITAGMLPALEGLTDALVRSAKNTNVLIGVGKALGAVLQALHTAIAAVSGAFSVLARTIGAVAEAAGKLARLDFVGAAAAARNGMADISQSIAGTIGTIRDIWTPPAGDSTVQVLAEDYDDLSVATTGARQSRERLTDAEREAARVADEMAREGARIYENTRTPAERYAAEVERLTRFLDAAAISQDTFNRALAQAQAEFERDDPLERSRRAAEEKGRQFRADSAQEAMDLARDHREEMEAATYDGIRGGLEAAANGDLGRYLALRIRDALFDNLAGVLTDILLGDSKGRGGALNSIGSWGSSLKKVFSAFTGGFPGFSTGGSFKVGGAPGKDKNFVGMNLTKGEMVDIRKPGQDTGGAMAVHVVPSPYFDVQVERVATPVAAGFGAQAFQGARQAVPADMGRRQRFSYPGVR